MNTQNQPDEERPYGHHDATALTLQADDAMAALKANSKLVLREEMMLRDSTPMRVWEH